MKKTLCLLLTVFLAANCNHLQNRLSINDKQNCVSWSNGTIQFSTDKESNDQKNNLPAFEAYVKKQDGKTIHMPIDAYALGYGGSSPMGTLDFYKPQKLAKAETLAITNEKLVIHLSYEPWTIYDEEIILDKQITIFKDSPILSVIDYYSGMFELLNIAAGMTTAYVGEIKKIENGFVVEYPYGITSVIVMPNAEEQLVNDTFGTVLLKKPVINNEPLRYYVGLSDKGEEYLLEELNKIL